MIDWNDFKRSYNHEQRYIMWCITSIDLLGVSGKINRWGKLTFWKADCPDRTTDLGENHGTWFSDSRMLCLRRTRSNYYQFLRSKSNWNKMNSSVAELVHFLERQWSTKMKYYAMIKDLKKRVNEMCEKQIFERDSRFTVPGMTNRSQMVRCSHSCIRHGNKFCSNFSNMCIENSNDEIETDSLDLRQNEQIESQNRSHPLRVIRDCFVDTRSLREKKHHCVKRYWNQGIATISRL
jgi:hypothetical protein